MTLASLPADILLAITGLVNEHAALANLALSCKSFLANVLGLPPWHSSGLRGGALFQGAAVPIGRALTILRFMKCELCNTRAYEFHPVPYAVFAHEGCLRRASVDVQNLTRHQRARVDAAGTPIVHTGGYGWELQSAWKEAHPAIDPLLTIAGAETLTLQEAAAKGAAYRARASAENARAKVLFVQEATRVNAERAAHLERYQAFVRAKEKRALDCTTKRRARLEAALHRADLPPIAQIMAAHGDGAGLADFLATRITAPFSVKQAVLRVRSLASNLATFAFFQRVTNNAQ